MNKRQLLRLAAEVAYSNPYGIWTRATVHEGQMESLNLAEIADLLVTHCRRREDVQKRFHARLNWLAMTALHLSSDAPPEDAERVLGNDLARIVAALVVLGEITDIEAQEALDDAQEAE